MESVDEEKMLAYNIYQHLINIFDGFFCGYY